MRNFPPRSVALSLFTLLSVLALAGCRTLGEEWNWSDVPDSKEPRAELAQIQHDIGFDAGSAHLAGAEQEKLKSFLERNAVAPGDRVFVVSGSGPENLSERRRKTVVAYLSHLSLPPSDLAGDFGFEEAGNDSVSVVVRRYIVTLPGCPDFTDAPGRTWNNTASRNWGCANAINLGVMVADPGDLVRGRPGGFKRDGEFAVLAIQRYRAGETKKLDPEDVGVVEDQQKVGEGDGGTQGE